MKIIENFIVNQIKKIDFKALITKVFEQHKDEIKEAIKELVTTLVQDVVEKFKDKN